MINHGRTLLLNVDGSNNPGQEFPGEEFVEPNFVAVPLNDLLTRMRGIFFGSDPDRAMLNWRLREYTNLIHSTELETYLTALDSRITYFPFRARGLFERGSFAPNTSTVSEASKLIAGTGSTTFQWFQPEKITAEDGCATFTGVGAGFVPFPYVETTKSIIAPELFASDFGFSIPAGATIQGVEVEAIVAAKGTAIGTIISGVLRSDVTLRKAGVNVGAELSEITDPYDITNTGAFGTFPFETQRIGGFGELWNETWTPEDINDPDFGLEYTGNPSMTYFGNTTGWSLQVAADAISVTVYYRDGSGLDQQQSRVHVIGEANDPSAEGRLQNSWDITVGAAGTTLITRKVRPAGESEEAYTENSGLTSLMPLIGTSLQFRLQDPVPGEVFQVELLLEPGKTMAQVLAEIDVMGEPFLIELFGVTQEEPYLTLRNLFRTNKALSYRLGAALVATILRTEERAVPTRSAITL